MVINAYLKEQVFGNADAIGKLIDKESENPMKVIGVINDIKEKGDYQSI
ncbi:hypothetical protein [Paraflavitalea speifideaquila]|nr:hypothetical protein [Paraflavitalea speifideiaquila]